MMSESARPNEVTVVSIISACSHLKALAEGKQWHGYIIKHLAVLDTFVHNALVNMYAICGCLSDAEKIFKNLGNRNEVSWTTMINAYGANGYLKEALELFKKMEAVGETPDEVTMLAVVSICAKLGRYDLGEWIDDYIERYGLYENIHIANALIDMHSKCGRIEKSCRIFGKMTRRTLITWTAMIRGLAMLGHGRVALTKFLQMQMEGFRLDEVAFLSMINACSHAGLVEEGKYFFMSMVEVHGIKPWMEHYGSMVDLLCRAGLLNEAFGFVVSMHLKPDIIIWRTLNNIITQKSDGNSLDVRHRQDPASTRSCINKIPPVQFVAPSRQRSHPSISEVVSALRAGGCCFNCTKPGHLARVCKGRRVCFTYHQPGHSSCACKGFSRSATSDHLEAISAPAVSLNTPPSVLPAPLSPLSAPASPLLPIPARSSMDDRPDNVHVLVPNSPVTAERAQYLSERCILVTVRGQLHQEADITGFVAR
ncbi:pentatricopeptide repeat-containing protein [Canna indica]|uniref:Pentatricopeptide repeat-containing protein n=1 Tax=Canna indica TaxID=4628 RepID=A0AAQ3KV73_9LILI|nr:pentatricopeptide repeat-containing protein [Canna indica]